MRTAFPGVRGTVIVMRIFTANVSNSTTSA
jgi:hypothetical protein